jgi:PEP-CTERM motif
MVALLLAGVFGLEQSCQAEGTVVYSTPRPLVEPWMEPTFQPGLPPPRAVPSKEYSHDSDATATPSSQPEQVIVWDGLGGTLDGKDFSGTRPLYAPDDDIDALANRYDALLDQVMADKAHLIFSVDDTITRYGEGVPSKGSYVPSAGPVPLSGGMTIGGAGELSYETAGGFSVPSSQGTWASQASINASPYPTDLDALELWGTVVSDGDPTPAEIFTPDLKKNKYSLADDYASFDTALPGDAVSIWNYDGTPFVGQNAIVGVVEHLLGTPADETLDYVPLIDVDAMMVFSQNGTSSNIFDSSSVDGPHDLLLFSIRQIADPEDASGYFATGSEIFWLDSSGASGFLQHGGHLWDKSYALENLYFTTNEGAGVVDINALEGVAVVPEPSSAALVLSALVVFGWWSRRRQAA